MPREKITHERRHIRLRIEILDELLSSSRRRTYKELLSALSSSLESKGEIPIKERMLKNDIAHLETLGAPIHRPTKKDNRIYYTGRFSLKTSPVDDDDIALLKQALSILKQATDIRLTSDFDEIITRLENKIHTNVPEVNVMIGFERHTQALGKEHFDRIFSAIQEKCPIKISYQPFGKEERLWIVHPYMLKSYRNRWFLIGRVNSNNYLSNIALDRIKAEIRNCNDSFIENNLFDPDNYFNNVIGVTIPVDQKQPTEITIKVHPKSADYIRTKPLHTEQEKIKDLKDGSLIIKLRLYINPELKSYLLSYGPQIEVLKPIELRDEIKKLYQEGLNLHK
jgi:predicted DNA-binding transcriptional regulator YafY